MTCECTRRLCELGMILQEHMQTVATHLLQKLEEVEPSSVLYPALAERTADTGRFSSLLKLKVLKGKLLSM